ncbi:hypothetical protein WAB17_08025 [Parerythrobacter aurantius]|uniref:hypothetical protein n=1 Tax=Parerythrobacter aurantius TaxID=3127706 RepID=UPI003254DD6D
MEDEAETGKVDATVACETELKRHLLTPQEFDPHLAGWVYSRKGPEGFVRREFTTMNGFGVELEQEYGCIYDLDASEIIYLFSDGPTGKTVFVDRPANN